MASPASTLRVVPGDPRVVVAQQSVGRSQVLAGSNHMEGLATRGPQVGAYRPDAGPRTSRRARVEAQRVLDLAARRLLAEQLDRDSVKPATATDLDPLDDSTHETSLLLER